MALCRRWPALPVIVTENRIRRTRRLIYRALDACDNLHLELSGYYLHRGIEVSDTPLGQPARHFREQLADLQYGHDAGDVDPRRDRRGGETRYRRR